MAGMDEAGEPARGLGCLDALVLRGGMAEASGWLLHPATPITAVRLRLDDVLVDESPVLDRPDVAAAFATVPHAARAGFRVRGPVANIPADRPLRVESIGLAHGHAVVAAEEYWPAAGLPPVPTPDAALMERVSAGVEPGWFNRAGYSIAAQLLAAVRRHLPARIAVPRLLDWGCGPARATRFMPQIWPGLRPAGCDIDAAAIAWCRANIPGGQFAVTDPFPPLPFPDGAFDAVVAASVMTHLGWDLQLRWLTEIRRVLAPGGVFAASLHGPLAAVPRPAAEHAALLRDGRLDAGHDARLDGIAPADYYRAIYQTEAATRAAWDAVLRVREYRAGGLGNWQDLVVLQRAPARRGWRAWVGA